MTTSRVKPVLSALSLSQVHHSFSSDSDPHSLFFSSFLFLPPLLFSFCSPLYHSVLVVRYSTFRLLSSPVVFLLSFRGNTEFPRKPNAINTNFDTIFSFMSKLQRNFFTICSLHMANSLCIKEHCYTVLSRAYYFQTFAA